MAGGTLLGFPVFRILTQNLSMPFIGLLTLSLVLIITGLLNIFGVVDKEKKAMVLTYFFTAPFVGIFCYFITLVIIGPIVIDTLGIIKTKLIAIVLSCLILMVYGKMMFFYKEVPPEVQPKNRKIKDIVLTCICFALAPFGFTGQLSYRGEAFGPMFGGILCLLFGVYFLYQATKEEESDE